MDGETLFRVSCDGPNTDISTCYERSNNVCGNNGYDIVRREPENRISTNGSQIVRRRITVRCKPTT